MAQKISSQNIKSVQYYPIRMVLEIQFYGDSSVYRYMDVPEDIWYGMRNVPNVDMYFNTQIMTQYKHVFITKNKNKETCE